MKKLFALLLCLAVVLCLYACVPEDSSSAPSTTQKPADTGTTSTSTTAPVIPTGPTTQPTAPTTQPTQPPEPTQPPQHIHSYGPWIVIQRQTCVKPEISTHICACNATEQIVTKEPGSHTYDEAGVCMVCSRKTSTGLAYQLAEDGRSYILISRHECQDEQIIIPETYQGLPVSAIGYAAFALGQMTSVEIPGSVQIIGDNAFQDCYRLREVVIASGVRQIGDWAFSGTAIRTVRLPKTLKTIGREAFHNCENLIAINAAEDGTSFNSVDGVLFTKDNSSLLIYPSAKPESSYKVPASVQIISDYAFLGCYNLTKVELPAGLVAIGASAFAGTDITSITIPKSVTFIGVGAFGTDRAGLAGDGDCDQLKEILVDKENAAYKSVDGVLLSRDGRQLLVYPAGKKGSSYTVPKGVTTIGDSAFVGCMQLTELVIPEGVTTVGNGAFSAGYYKSSALESIHIPESVTQIGDSALAFCENLLEIFYAGNQQRWESIPKGTDWDLHIGDYMIYFAKADPEPEPTLPPEPSLPTPEPSVDPTANPPAPEVPTPEA